MCGTSGIASSASAAGPTLISARSLEARGVEVAPRDLGDLLVDLQARQLPARRQPARDADRAVARERPDLERLARVEHPRQQRQQRALVGPRLHHRVGALARLAFDAREHVVPAGEALEVLVSFGARHPRILSGLSALEAELRARRALWCRAGPAAAAAALRHRHRRVLAALATGAELEPEDDDAARSLEAELALGRRDLRDRLRGPRRLARDLRLRPADLRRGGRGRRRRRRGRTCAGPRSGSAICTFSRFLAGFLLTGASAFGGSVTWAMIGGAGSAPVITHAAPAPTPLRHRPTIAAAGPSRPPPLEAAYIVVVTSERESSRASQPNGSTQRDPPGAREAHLAHGRAARRAVAQVRADRR